MFHVLHHSYDHSLYVNDDSLSTDACSSMLRIRTCHVRQLGVVLGLGRESQLLQPERDDARNTMACAKLELVLTTSVLKLISSSHDRKHNAPCRKVLIGHDA